jgi:hypothetical protein
VCHEWSRFLIDWHLPDEQRAAALQSPTRRLRSISALPAYSAVVVVLDSPGGSLGEGIARGKFFHRANIISFVGLLPS